MGWGQTGDLGPFTIYTTRRRRSVWFPKSPPLQPPSLLQIFQRNRFRMAAKAWRQIGRLQRQSWKSAAARAHLAVTGYNLFIYWQLRRDRSAIATIERRSGITLIAD